MRVPVLAACLVALAQSQQPPSFRSGVSLVTVDVTVVDASGKPVPGLTAADFEVRLNNRVQPIRDVTYMQVAETMAGAVGPSFDAAPTPAAVAAAAKGTTTAPRVFVLLVDDLSLSPLAGKELLGAAERFVSALPATDLVGVTTSSGATVTNPTADRAPVLASLKKIVGVFQDPRFESYGPASGKAAHAPDQQTGIAQALDIDRGDTAVLKQAIANECYNGNVQIFSTQSLEQVLASDSCARTVQLSATRTAAQMKAIVQRQAQAFESVIRAMRSASGIRHLVVLTDGVALSQDNQTMIPVARAAAEAGVQLSTIMATGDISLADPGRRSATQVDVGAPQRRREDNQMFLNGARTTTDMAGGEFYQVTGTPDRFFDRIRTASSAIYRLAVEVPPDTPPGKDFALSARVLKRSGVTARANRHAIAAAPSSTAPAPASPPRAVVPPAEQMRRAIASGRAMNGLDVSVERSVRRAADPAQVSIDVAIAISGAVKAPLNTMFGLVDAGGAIRTADRTIDAPDANGAYRLTLSVPVAPGAYKLRFAAADASGAVGAVESAVDARLTTMGPFQASGIAIAPLPGSRRGILVAIELYPPASAPSDVIVKMAVVSGSDPAVERVIVPEPVDGALRAEAEFMLDSLPPGASTIRATVLNGATVIGTVTRALPR